MGKRTCDWSIQEVEAVSEQQDGEKTGDGENEFALEDKDVL